MLSAFISRINRFYLAALAFHGNDDLFISPLISSAASAFVTLPEATHVLGKRLEADNETASVYLPGARSEIVNAPCASVATA